MREPAQDAVTPHRDGIAQPPRTARRRPWIAGVCSAITPGLGQGYNGQATKALLWYGLGWGVGLAALAIPLGVPTAPWNVAMPGLVVLSWYVYIILDAILTARRQGHTYHVKSYNKWYLYLLLIVIGAVIGEAKASTIRTWGTQAFKIPSGAMEETLLIGDHILVQKFAYRQHAPARGDLVVFPFPRDPSRDVIKRVIGLPGDRIEVRHHCERSASRRALCEAR